jgi:hypothetical protein
MRVLVLCMAAAVCANAGVVRGVVLEHVSGRALARSRVRLEPLDASAKAIQVRSTMTGQFSFIGVADGYYRLIAARDGYFAASYGQRRPAGQGIPVLVTRDSDLFSELRMRRMGAITGRVVDDNDIGITGMAVVAYRARLPLRIGGRATTDDRGVYRIHGLHPGKYWVRTTAHVLDDGSGMLPTFGPEGREPRDARMHDVALDRDSTDADIRPKAGNLFRLRVTPRCMGGPVNITLSSETGRTMGQVGCLATYVFEGLAPGGYEVFATKQGTSDSAFTETFMDSDTGIPMQLVPQQPLGIDVVRPGGSQGTKPAVTLVGRRQDMGNAENEDSITPMAKLAPGRWEISGRVASGEFVQSIENLSRIQQRAWRSANPASATSADWFAVLVEMGLPTGVRVVVSTKAAQIMARVTWENKGVPGAPVFLWPKDEAPRRSLKGWLQAYADAEGQVRFDTLAPGEYRLLATFDITEPDEQVLEEARAPSVRIAESDRSVLDLPLWVAP